MAPSHSKLSGSLLLFGGVSLVAIISSLCYYFFFRKRQNLLTAPEPTKKRQPTESDPKSDQPAPAKPAASPAAKVEPKAPPAPPAVEVEDDDDDEDDENEEQEDKAAKELLKQQYDDALRLASKFLAGNKYDKAAEKYSAAIDLTTNVNASRKEIITLYNNRSAMYEKMGELETSLNDITVVLAMDIQHVKARGRRARIYEAQGKIATALQDIIAVMILERSKGEMSAASATKVDALSKLVVAEQVRTLMPSIRNAVKTTFPSKAHCRQYLESFPTYHIWKQQFADVDRANLLAALTASGGAFNATDTWTSVATNTTPELVASRFESAFVLACYDLAFAEFATAFTSISAMYTVLQSASQEDSYKTLLNIDTDFKRVVAQIYELYGTQQLLLGSLTNAENALKQSFEWQPLPAGLDTALKLASLYIEQDSMQQATALYLRMCGQYNEELADDCTSLAWVLIHRVGLWLVRDENGKYTTAGYDSAQKDLEKAVAITKNHAAEESKQCHFAALLKLIQLLTQTKMQMGVEATEAEQQYIKELFASAKKLIPEHETIQILQADMMCMDNRVADALALCNSIVDKSDPEDALPLLIRANIMAHKAMVDAQAAQEQGNYNGVMEAQQTLQDVSKEYEKALALEPNGIEALAQFANFKSVTGDIKGTLELTEKALKNIRSKDELYEILQVHVMADAQVKAIEEFQQAMGGANA